MREITLLVKTFLAPSGINGIGLFAAEQIPKGTPVWEFTEGRDFEMSEVEFNKLKSPHDKDFVSHYGYKSKATGKYVMCIDDARFFNHSNHPNTDNQGESTVANRDIEPGEELTCDYYEFDAEAEIKLGGLEVTKASSH